MKTIKPNMETEQAISELLELYHAITFESMKVPKWSWKRFFRQEKDDDAEAFIYALQTKVETLVNTKLKNKLTFNKGIPYIMYGKDEFIKKMKEILE